MGAGRPRFALVAQQRTELRGAVLGQLAVGRQLAAPDIEQRRACRRVGLQQIVSRDLGGRAAFVQGGAAGIDGLTLTRRS